MHEVQLVEFLELALLNQLFYCRDLLVLQLVGIVVSEGLLEAILHAYFQYRFDEDLHCGALSLVLGKYLDGLYEIDDVVGKLPNKELKHCPLLLYVTLTVVGHEEVQELLDVVLVKFSSLCAARKLRTILDEYGNLFDLQLRLVLLPHEVEELQQSFGVVVNKVEHILHVRFL